MKAILPLVGLLVATLLPTFAAVLGHGTLPISVLRQVVDRWIRKEVTRSR